MTYLFQVGGLLIVRHVEELRLQNAAERDDWLPPMILNPLKDLRAEKPTSLHSLVQNKKLDFDKRDGSRQYCRVPGLQLEALGYAN